MGLDDLSKQRIDYRDNADGSVTAILSVSLPGGRLERYETTVGEHEAVALANALVLAEGPVVAGYKGGTKAFFALAARMQKEAAQIEKALLARGVKKGSAQWKQAGKEWGDRWKKLNDANKRPFGNNIGAGLKKIASSKVFKLAAKGLGVVGMVAPPPIGTAALAAGGALSVASKLAGGKVAEALGAPKTAVKLVNAAKKDATKTIDHLTKKKVVTPEKKREMVSSLLQAANRKRKGAEKYIAPRSGAIVAAARAGKLKSNRPGPVTANQLKEAHAKGRVFWLAS